MNMGQRPDVSVAFIHHANQLLITDGYQNREGISAIAGSKNSTTGLLRILELHRRYQIPLNLHISGTLMESLEWHIPDFFSELKALANSDLLELLGSSYGQNMMKFFSEEHNFRQLNEELLLYENFLGWESKKIKVFWVPERLWDTKILAPVLTNSRLRNGGYEYVILDDRLLYSDKSNPSPRRLYDKTKAWDPKNFSMYGIEEGHGLCMLPIAYNLRQNIPPRKKQDFESIKSQLYWLLDVNLTYKTPLIAIYADDMEKAAGVGWDSNGPAQYESVLKWINENPTVHSVKLSKWTSMHRPLCQKHIERGTYVELMNEFEASETYDNWYYDPSYHPYRQQYAWAESRVQELTSYGADPALADLAWKVLLATSWQTAWHTPKTGAHGDSNSEDGPSPWIRATANHCRLAAIMAEAAYWMKHKDRYAHAYHQDIDGDDNTELVIKNNALFAVFSPKTGGRLVYLFSIGGSSGRLVVGNPIDDWNLLEGLHEYMDSPPNHPGAFSDVGYEHDNYDAMIECSEGSEISVRLRNTQKGSSAFGTEKSITLKEDQNVIHAEYRLSDYLVKRFSTQIGLSPDYLGLLRHGHSGLKEYSPFANIRGWSNNGVIVWVKFGNEDSVFWDNPPHPKFGHGYILRLTSHSNRFKVWLGVDLDNC